MQNELLAAYKFPMVPSRAGEQKSQLAFSCPLQQRTASIHHSTNLNIGPARTKKKTMPGKKTLNSEEWNRSPGSLGLWPVNCIEYHGIKSICGRLPKDGWLIISLCCRSKCHPWLSGSRSGLFMRNTRAGPCAVALSEVKVCCDVITMQ